MILSAITIFRREENADFNFSNQAEDASFYTGTMAFVVATIAALLAPIETYNKRRNLHAAGALPGRSSVSVNHLLITKGFLSTSRFN